MTAETDSSRQRRRFERRECQHPIRVVFEDAGHHVEVNGECRTLSPGGFGAVLTRELPRDRIVAIQFQPPRMKSLLSLQARVLYESEGMQGFEFIAPDEKQRELITTLFREAVAPSADGL